MVTLQEKIMSIDKKFNDFKYELIGNDYYIRPIKEGSRHEQKIAETIASRMGFVLDDDRIVDYVDPIITRVKNKFTKRSNVGIKKYGTTLDSNKKYNYILAAQEEAMDLTNYLETLLKQHEDITQMVRDTPNDTELGNKIRRIYGI